MTSDCKYTDGVDTNFGKQKQVITIMVEINVRNR